MATSQIFSRCRRSLRRLLDPLVGHPVVESITIPVHQGVIDVEPVERTNAFTIAAGEGSLMAPSRV